MRYTCVILLSGGIDSTALAFKLAREARADGRPIRGLFLNHGRSRNHTEVRSARTTAHMLDIPLDIGDVSGIRTVYVGNRPGVPLDLEAELAIAGVVDDDRTPIVKRHNQNGLSAFSLMLNMALYYTHTVQGDELNIGLIKSQMDERPRFAEYMTALGDLDRLMNPTLPRVDVRAPLLGMTKAEVLAEALRLGCPVETTRSCVYGGELHCGKCEGCLERREAFTAIGRADPTRYAERHPFPETLPDPARGARW